MPIDFLDLKTEAFGLDISDLSLKIAQLKKEKKSLVLASFGEESIPPGVIKNGEIKNEKLLAEIIKGSLKKASGEAIKTKYVVASLPEEKAYLQVIQLPSMPEEDLRSAIVFAAENYIPLPIDQVYLDYQVISRLDHFDVLLAALPKTTVDPYLSCLEAAGLSVKALEIESLSIARALVGRDFLDRSLLIIDLGSTRTSFIVFAGGSVRFTSSIPVSSSHFTKIIAKAMNITEVEAEELKIKYGLEEKVKVKIVEDGKTELEREKGQIFEALVPALVDLIQQIKKHLNYYREHASHEHLAGGEKGVSRILFCGGGGNLQRLAELLSLALKIPVKLGDPWKNILVKGQAQSLGYATVLGLALRGIKGDTQ